MSIVCNYIYTLCTQVDQMQQLLFLLVYHLQWLVFTVYGIKRALNDID